MSDDFWSKKTRDTWFYILLALSAASVMWVFWTYLYVILYAGVTVVCCWPAYRLLLRATRGRAWAASSLTTLLLALLVFVPIGIVAWLFVLEVQEVSQTLIEMVQTGELSKMIDDALAAFEVPDALEAFLPELPEFPDLPTPREPPAEGVAVIAEYMAQVTGSAAGDPVFTPITTDATVTAVERWMADLNDEIAQAAPSGGLSELLGRLSEVEEEFTSGLQDAALGALRFAGGELPGIVNAAVNLSIDSLIYVFAVLVIFVEGPGMLTFFKRLLPIDDRYSSDLFQVFGEFSRNMVIGSLATAAIQGFVAGIGFAIAGIDKVIFLAILVFFGSFVPVVGTPVVWLPVVIYMFASGDYAMATFLTIWSIVLVGTIDNVLRPLFMRGSSEMHALLIFLAVFGGMYWMGLAGLLVGPVIVAVFMALYRIYLRDYLKIAPQPEPEEPGFTSRLAGRVIAAVGGWFDSAGRDRAAGALLRWGDLLQHGESERPTAAEPDPSRAGPELSTDAEPESEGETDPGR